MYPDAIEMRKIIFATENHKGPLYIRIAKGHEEIVTNKLYKNFKIGNIYSYDKKYNTAIFNRYHIPNSSDIQKLLKKGKINV